ncbi:S41 family peptidase [Robertkochia flava]|uniref:hypothetical protein n=1 Tax=Robertkochia flava TaxID=3447986 RepID=UPI001CCF8F52|nr:hypothetical protein [Robertkochia marina]
MKQLITLIFVLGSYLGGIAQEEVNWKSDLEFLKTTIDTEYPFLYKKISREDFNKRYNELYAQVESMEDYEAVCGIMELVSSFEYGHTSVGLRGTDFELRQLPVNLMEFKDGIFIEGISEEYKEDAGARVLKIAGEDVMDVYRQVYPYFPAENSQFFKAYGMNFLVYTELLAKEGLIPDPEAGVTLTLEKNGKSYERTLKPMEKGKRPPTDYGYTKNEAGWISARDQGFTPNYLKHLDRIYYSEFLNDNNAMYVRQSQIQDDSLVPIPEFYDKVFEEIREKHIDKLVIDVRLNGGGNNYKNKAVIKDIIAHPEIDRVGHLFVILGDRTFSACQNLVNELDNYTNAIFIGEPTGENINFYGDNNKVVLPESEIPVYLSFAWWQDKPQWENQQWLPPHIAVQLSFEDYLENRDPVLDAALNFRDDDFILDPMDHLTALFMKGDVETLKSEAFRLSRDDRYVFFDFENRFAEVAERLLSSGQVNEAMFVGQLNTELYPEAAVSWAGLAKALKQSGREQEAREAAEKAMQLCGDSCGIRQELASLLSSLEE